MDDMRRYLDASTRANTVRSYQSAMRHFEVDWGGHLPATPDSVARYLSTYAAQLSINTLKQRLAALAHWHAEQGFADPTRAPLVKKILKGIRALHPATKKQAVPLQLTELGMAADWLETAATHARRCGDVARAMRCERVRALILMGF